jgi:hypothetical protein
VVEEKIEKVGVMDVLRLRVSTKRSLYFCVECRMLRGSANVCRLCLSVIYSVVSKNIKNQTFLAASAPHLSVVLMILGYFCFLAPFDSPQQVIKWISEDSDWIDRLPL